MLIRTDSGGGTHDFLAWLSRLGRPPGTARRVGRRADRPAGPVLLAEGDAGHRPQGTPPLRGQLRFTDISGHRVTCFAADARTGQLADLELRHRRHARCEDRIRCAKDTSLRNLPLRGFDQNQVWCELVAMARELTAWMAMLALDGPARAWETNSCGCACSPPPDASSTAADGCGCARRLAPIGPP